MVRAAASADRPAPLRGEVRLAELVAALSLGVDLGFGQPMEHVLRQCVISLRLADRLGMDERARSALYYSALLVNVGCHADAHEQAKWFGDDIALKATKYSHEMRSLRGAAVTLRLIGSGNPPLHRFRIGLEFALRGHRDTDRMIQTHSEIARTLARQLGLGADVQAAVGAAYERWDGRGWPGDLAGERIPIASRVTQLCEYIEVAHRVGGVGAATALARARRGSQFDPELADTFCSAAEDLLADLDEVRTFRTVIDAEPALGPRLSGDRLDEALLSIGDFVDLKSPFTLGHARAVADLAARAAVLLGLPTDDVSTVRRAGLVHGLGRLGVSNAIWDKAGPLGAGEEERVRMHPYLTERMLSQSPTLAPLGRIAVQYRERLDGSGYPRGLSGAEISRPARILGAADAYQSMREPRPHRPARSGEDAAAELRRDVRAGRLDGDAVDAVLTAAGHRAPRRREGPAGLTAREVDVLRLLARGLSSRQIATDLVITPKTARNHIEHIYSKIGASSRAGASLFAVRHGLLAVD
jgi:HD-GYP domain-containing protein (c-di-GMP phosphodiesterase class II)